MAEARNHGEPTMEEILASIRRIIVEEDSASSALTAADGGYDSAVRAIDRVDVEAPPASWPPPVQEAILDTGEPARNDVPADAMPPPANRPRLSRFGHDAPPLKSADVQPRGSAEAAMSASVASLARAANLSRAARQPELPLGAAGRTLEDMVRELVRPHLQEWLDAHLPRLVERVVRDEIGRLVRDIQQR